tara:strand:+ start:2446 stop:2943 length:498 start_codon:yes stop_codon:yes gene_type:complete
MEEISEELMNVKFPRSYYRKCVMQEDQKSYEGFVLGDIYSWAHKDVKETGAGMRKSRRHEEHKYDKLWDLTQDIAQHIEYTSVQYNRNQKCKKHIDGNNTGISTIIGLGDYEGGELLVYYDGEDEEPHVIDIHDKFYSFDGAKYYHETADFTGDRFSLVFFNRHY